MGPGSVWTVAENLDPTGIRSPDRPARSQALYGLTYTAHKARYGINKILFFFHERNIKCSRNFGVVWPRCCQVALSSEILSSRSQFIGTYVGI